MENEPDKKLNDLKERLAKGDYAVDPEAVADAILRRSREIATLRVELREARSGDGFRGGAAERQARPDDGHNVCSNPSSRLAASWKLAPGAPRTARPIQVIRALGSAVAIAASNTRHALGGMHAHSS